MSAQSRTHISQMLSIPGFPLADPSNGPLTGPRLQATSASPLRKSSQAKPKETGSRAGTKHETESIIAQCVHSGLVQLVGLFRAGVSLTILKVLHRDLARAVVISSSRSSVMR